MDKFELVAPYAPTGDQPEAIEKLVSGIENGLKEQVLLGVTGSGKTFTMANIIANVNSDESKKRKKRKLLNDLYTWACSLESRKPESFKVNHEQRKCKI